MACRILKVKAGTGGNEGCASSKLLYGFEIVEQEIIILMEYISLI